MEASKDIGPWRRSNIKAQELKIAFRGDQIDHIRRLKLETIVEVEICTLASAFLLYLMQL